MLLFIVLSILLFVVLVFGLWVDHQTSGRFSRLTQNIDILILVSIFAILRWRLAGQFQTDLLTTVVVVFVIVRAAQYFWYVGFLRGIRRGHIEHLRAKWQAELKWIEYHKNVLTMEAEIFAHCFSPIRDEVSRHNTWVTTRDLKREAVLLRKIKTITP